MDKTRTDYSHVTSYFQHFEPMPPHRFRILLYLWIVIPVTMLSQQDTARYQLKLGIETGYAAHKENDAWNVAVTGVWHPKSFPFGIEIRTGFGDLTVSYTTNYYFLLGAGISIVDEKRGPGAYLAVTLVKPIKPDVSLRYWSSRLRGGVLNTANIWDAVCIEPGLIINFFNVQIAAFLRMSLRKSVSSEYEDIRGGYVQEKSGFSQAGLGLYYVFSL